MRELLRSMLFIFIVCLLSTSAIAQTPCDDFGVIGCAEDDVRSQTCGLGNDIEEGCGASGISAHDVWWEISLNQGGSFTADVQCEWTDMVLWIMSTCNPATWTCLDMADETDDQTWPIEETITYTNDTGGVQTVYLVVDGHNAGECDDCMILFTCTGGLVATELETWGGIKSLLR